MFSFFGSVAEVEVDGTSLGFCDSRNSLVFSPEQTKQVSSHTDATPHNFPDVCRVSELSVFVHVLDTDKSFLLETHAQTAPA